MALNERQEAFCEEYIIDLNATQAAIRAGYSKKTSYSIGQRLLKHVEVATRVKELREARAEKLNLDAYWVLKRLMDISDRSIQAEPVLEWNNEEKRLMPTGEYQFDSNGANKSTELIGKHLGMFKDTVKHEGELGIRVVVDYGDEES
jgi:phage terminase small subunit